MIEVSRYIKPISSVRVLVRSNDINSCLYFIFEYLYLRIIKETIDNMKSCIDYVLYKILLKVMIDTILYEEEKESRLDVGSIRRRFWNSWVQASSHCNLCNLNGINGLFYIPSKHLKVLTYSEYHMIKFCFSFLFVIFLSFSLSYSKYHWIKFCFLSSFSLCLCMFLSL